MPSILCEYKVAVTSCPDYTNIAGTMELGNTTNSINQNKVNLIVNVVDEFFQQKIQLENKNIWMGYRPCSSNGLPIIESVDTKTIVATGHGMMGVSMAPKTGVLINELMDSGKAGIYAEFYKS